MSASEQRGASDAIDGEALDWALRMAEPDADWDVFTAWLEADPTHAERYDRASLALQDATDLVAAQAPVPPIAANDQDVPSISSASNWYGRRTWLGGAMAAALVGAIGLGVWENRDQSYTVATAGGERRTVTLADGSAIVLAGGSRVRLDSAAPRSATVEAGEMLFRVKHDARRPFRVQVRDLTLTDLGTVFDVRVVGERTHVAVAEGAVMVAPEGAAVRLDPGQAIVSDGKSLRRETTEVADVGAWQEGRLVFDDATLRDVAEGLSRHLGRRITAAPAVASRTFNGTLETALLKDDPALLGDLLGVRVRHDGDDWTLDAQR